ncbi:BTB/POZ domain-containing protein 25 [Elsinoe australis]|uniref:BTB/POZ domain-containing protein 25 n=1 Tax=Elsinoe australis TaxID=40998 RepID=A0A4U7AM16_9PEZI|nr:BTB/POZ domain-containing protein 25 [Elsinoe australis]
MADPVDDMSSDDMDESDTGEFEVVGELQEQERDRAAQRQKRSVSFAIPQPVDHSSSTSDRQAPATGSETTGGSHPGLKRKRSSDSNGPNKSGSGRDVSVEVLGDISDGQRANQNSKDASIPRSEGARKSTDGGEQADQPGHTTQSEERRFIAEIQNSSMVLPARLVFPIQVGSELFRLSGASISSDAPSYFSKFFQAQLESGTSPQDIKTLYIDRDPDTFRDISLHLQGYHIEPRDGTHFVRLYADAMFFSLPRLIDQLYKSTIFIRVGEEEFKIPRDLFNGPGDTPNYFSLGFSIFFSSPGNVFPGLDKNQLLRPPSILPPQVTGRSSYVFRDLLHVLKGYDLHIRNEEHRCELLRDARYFHFKGLEQRLIAHQIIHNVTRKRKEIILRLDDLRPSGIKHHVISRSPIAPPSTTKDAEPSTASLEALIAYSRPYIDTTSYDLILEIPSGIQIYCSLEMPENKMVLDGSIKQKITLVINVACNKIEQELGLAERPEVVFGDPKAIIERSAHVKLDGRAIDWRNVEEGPNDLSKLWIASLPEPPEDEEVEARSTERWTVGKSQWRLKVVYEREPRPRMVVDWEAVRIEAVSSEATWNEERGWL